MSPEELQALAAVEAEHWFYSGKRELVRRCLDRLGVLTPSRLVVDVGAGTGLFAAELQARVRVVAVDELTAVPGLVGRLGTQAVVVGRAECLPVVDGVADAVTSLDVVEHLEDDLQAVREFLRVLKPGGVMVLTAPAFPALWSGWDVALQHRRRSRRRGMQALLEGAGAVAIRVGYVNTVAFLPVLVLRRWQDARGLDRIGVRFEDRVPPAWLNRFLRWMFVAPVRGGLPAPFGLSVLAIARKAGGQDGGEGSWGTGVMASREQSRARRHGATAKT